MNILLVFEICIFSQPAMSQNDYEIYSIILSHFQDKALAIVKETHGLKEYTKYESLKEAFKTLQKETFDDYISKLEMIDTLKNEFKTNKDILLLNSSTIKEIFADTSKDGWDAFYDKFGKTQGITTFSRIGYNKDRSQALVYHGTQSHWLAGGGYYTLFTLKKGKWVQVSSLMAWIS